MLLRQVKSSQVMRTCTRNGLALNDRFDRCSREMLENACVIDLYLHLLTYWVRRSISKARAKGLAQKNMTWRDMSKSGRMEGRGGITYAD